MGDPSQRVEFVVQVRPTGAPDSFSIGQEADRVIVHRDSSDLEDVREITAANYEGFLAALGHPMTMPVMDAVRASVAAGALQELVRAIREHATVTTWRLES